MASFSEILGVAQQGQQMPSSPMPYVPGMPPMAPPVQAPMPEIQQVQVPQGEQQTPEAPTPPATPEEFEQRKSGWKTLLDGFMAQPNAKELMMLVALKLAQGRRPGQSTLSQFAEAAGTGMMANQFYKHNQLEDAEKQKAQAREDQKFNLDIRRGTAQADKAEAENDFYGKTRAQALQEIELGIENLKRKGKFEDARLVEQEWQNGNLRAAWELTKRDKESSIWARNEQVKISRQNANKVPAAGQAKKDLENLVRRANPIIPGETPEAYDQRIAQATLGMQTTSKSNSAADWTKYAETLEDGPERDAALSEAKRLLTGRSPTAPTGGTATKTFATEAALIKAFNAKQVKIGDTVVVNGKKFTVQP